MLKAKTFAGKKCAVFGLGRSGIATALTLQEGGAQVFAWDDNEKTREIAKAQGVAIFDLNQLDFAELYCLAMTPGVPIYGEKTHWAATKALEKEVPILGDIEIFAREINAIPEEMRPKVVAITGTNGKSTTTALIAHILSNAGKDVRIGGNIGTGVLSLDEPRPGSFYVLELSSYQLDLTKSLHCEVAVLLNVSEDHLERHGNMARYVAAKRNIFANQGRYDTAIIGVDDDYGESLCTRLMAQGSRSTIPISSWQFVGCGISAIGSLLWDNTSGRNVEVADLSLAKALPGAHNGQNAAAAYAACKALGLSQEIIARGLYSFGGLKHRLQEVCMIANVRFFNDSKATNADASAQALRAFPRIRWIVGGQAKTDGIDPLIPLFNHVTKAYLIGEASEKFAKTLGKVPYEKCGTIERAVKAAYEDAREEDGVELVVMSPACASFDQYSDFEKRGDDFIHQVEILRDQYGADLSDNVIPFSAF